MASRMQAALYNLSTLNDRVEKFQKLNEAWFAKHDQGYFHDPSVGWESRSYLDHRTRGVQWRDPASHIQDDMVLPNDAELQKQLRPELTDKEKKDFPKKLVVKLRHHGIVLRKLRKP